MLIHSHLHIKQLAQWLDVPYRLIHNNIELPSTSPISVALCHDEELPTSIIRTLIFQVGIPPTFRTARVRILII